MRQKKFESSLEFYPTKPLLRKKSKSYVDNTILKNELSSQVVKLLDRLEQKRNGKALREVIEGHFFHNKTLRKIGEKYDKGKQTISLREKRALTLLLPIAKSMGLEDYILTNQHP